MNQELDNNQLRIFIQKLTDKLKTASGEVANVVYGGDGDSDELNFLAMGWRLGVAYQHLREVVESIEALEHPLKSAEQTKEALYWFNQAASHLMEASLGAIDEDGQVELLKLGWRLGLAVQMIHPFIVSFASLSPEADVEIEDTPERTCTHPLTAIQE
jgi:hypothetical protein